MCVESGIMVRNLPCIIILLSDFNQKKQVSSLKFSIKHKDPRKKFQSYNKKAINFTDENLTSKTSQNLDFMFVLWEHDNHNGEGGGR